VEREHRDLFFKINDQCWRQIDRSGLEADQKVIAAHSCYAMTATTALTAQNTRGVFGIHETPSDFVRKQIEACIDDIGVDVVKTGTRCSLDEYG
jgi:hydroxymethylpyrimidine/phosphomethylpyrimidine kinase